MIKQLDIFGSQILLRFKGQHTYNTRFGSFFTLLIISVIGFRLFFIVKDIFLRNSPQVILSDRQVDDPALFEMTNSTFPVAFAMQDPKTFNAYIDESIYVIKAYQQVKRLVFNQTTNVYDSVWDTPISLKIQPCSTLNFGNPTNSHYYLKLQYQNYYCFDPSAVLTIQGDFNSNVYSQVRFIVQKCQKNCKPQDVIDKFLLKATFSLQMSDAYVDPTIKDNPFVSYSRDFFWPTSTLMPKDVNIYLRNNYVQSDFGWVLSDIKEQKFPTFSYYEAAVYPPDYQTYFLQVLFRFEKQKESVYHRYYKNLNNIISEIGGFTQSLLAIGILICSRVSQLQLNQEIINQAFNYDEDSEAECSNGDKNMLQQPVKDQSSPNIINNQKDQVDAEDNTNAYKILLNSRLQMQKTGNSRLMAQNKNDNTVSINEIKKDADIQSISFNQDITQNFNAFNSNYKFQQPASLQSGILQHKQQFSPPVKEFSKEEANAKEQQPSPLKKEHQQILNLLLMEDSSEQNDDKETKLERSTSKEVKIHKQKKKIIKLEQKLKEDRFKELMEKQTKSMRMSIWEYIKSSVWPFGELKKKKQIINYSIDKLYYNLDIFNIVKRLIEVEKLKRLLLDQDQIKLFDYLPKPTIHSDCVLKKDMKQSLSKQYEVDIMYQDNRTEMQKVKDAFQSYKKIIKKTEHSKLDQKIIDLLDPNLLFLFQTQQNQQAEAEIQKSKKPDSPLQVEEVQSYRQSHQQEQAFEQDLSTLRNEIKLLKQALSSPRMELQQQPIISISSDNMEMINLESIQQRNSNYPSVILQNNSTQKNQENKQNEQEQSFSSEIAIEDIQNQPNQFVAKNKNSEIQFKIDS
ncbi:transmembrane protein, putative (macronuclear) [Tetrahymena thermophila SB210]|uniref:Transmembrane protein, putative n=1 Tax=Tetrahymena thermophila (strain SB210) TaxID=312017 RepID=I7M252_TETTS|nr:transmembrane protein, putative [Tetrahymena thermophila SB210]EAR98492.1 transmembrane protein, putative [Tetrahymena thermophila SB210]|eukprot:XP_001018737.1 transmembrane protein, putative [Tetrahymena thermophila SB210]